MSRVSRAERVLPPYAQWLDRQYVTWQVQQGRRVKQAEFAHFLGLSVAQLNGYLNGHQTPRPALVDQIAIRLDHDFSGHDLLGLPQPDLNWLRLVDCWPRLSAEAQTELAVKAEALT